MLLALDLGNTNLTLGLFDGDVLLESWRLETVHSRTEDEYALLVRQMLDLGGYAPSAVDGIILASVVPVLTPTMQGLCRRLFPSHTPTVVGPGTKTGVSVRYDPPKDVGADRIVNAVAAYARFGRACVVVDFGTATTFDSVLADGTYAGGAIAPGVHVSMAALFSRAAKLPKVDLVRPDRVVGRSTIESIQSGAYFGYVSLVDGLVTRFREEMGGGDIPVVATGGLATQIARDALTIDCVDPDLTLDGLRRIYAMNRPLSPPRPG